MAITPFTAFGQLEMEYSSYGHPHVFRCWVDEFGTDSGIGTFTNPTAPLSLDALATALSGVIKGMFNSDASLSWGPWTGLKITAPATGARVPIVEGTVTPGTGTLSTARNDPGAVTQMTATFRDSDSLLVKLVALGSVYPGNIVFHYSAIGGGYKDLVDYALGSAHIRSKAGNVLSSFVSMTFDTNDGLQRRYRR